MSRNPHWRELCVKHLSVDRENLTESLVAQKLRFLEVNDAQIRNLQGLEGAVNLETLVLKDNLIQDLSPLSELANLRKLDLAGNRISSLQDLIPLSRSKMERRAFEIQSSSEGLQNSQGSNSRNGFGAFGTCSKTEERGLVSRCLGSFAESFAGNDRDRTPYSFGTLECVGKCID